MASLDAGYMGWKVRPINVRFESFTSDTYAMQRDGWQISQDWRAEYQTMTMAFRHPRLRLYMMSVHLEDFNPVRSGGDRDEFLQGFEIPINSICTEIEVMRMNVQEGSVGYFDRFSAVDATPRMYASACEKISDFNIFEPIPKTEDIIVKPDSVPDLMARILDLQEPKMKEIIERQRNQSFIGDSRGEKPVEVKTHAKIISIAS